MNPLILPAMGLIIPLLFFSKDGFGIKLPQKFDMLLNNVTNQPNPNLVHVCTFLFFLLFVQHIFAI